MIELNLAAALCGAALAQAMRFQSFMSDTAKLMAAKESAGIEPIKYQNSITPPRLVQGLIALFAISISLIALAGYQSGLTAAVVAFGSLLAGVVLSILASTIFGRPTKENYRAIVIHSLSNREADYRRDGDLMRADTAKRFLNLLLIILPPPQSEPRKNSTGSWIIAAAILLVTFCFIWLFRFDTSLKTDGSLLLRNRITGHVEVCNHRGQCQQPTLQDTFRNQSRMSAEEEALLNLAGEQIIAEAKAEQQKRSDQRRLEKNYLARSADILISLGLGFVQPLSKSWSLSFGSNAYPRNIGVRDLWGLPHDIDDYQEELSRQSITNARASNGGFLAGVVFYLLSLGFLGRSLARRLKTRAIQHD